MKKSIQSSLQNHILSQRIWQRLNDHMPFFLGTAPLLSSRHRFFIRRFTFFFYFPFFPQFCLVGEAVVCLLVMRQWWWNPTKLVSLEAIQINSFCCRVFVDHLLGQISLRQQRLFMNLYTISIRFPSQTDFLNILFITVPLIQLCYPALIKVFFFILILT